MTRKKQDNNFVGVEAEQYYLHDKMMADEASNQEIVYLSLLRGMITQEQYLDFLQIEKDCDDCGED